MIATSCSARGAEELPEDRLVGRLGSTFELRDVRGGDPVRLGDFLPIPDQGQPLAEDLQKKAVVLVFLGVECPVGDLYMPRLAELAREYGPRGVVFLGINSNAHDDPEDIAAHAREFDVPFPVLRDPGNVVADVYLAGRTCEAVVLSHNGRIRYRGAIDDQYDFTTRREDGTTTHFLADALDAILDDKSPPVRATPVVGCLIDRVEASRVVADIPRIRPAPEEIVEARVEIEEAAGPFDLGEVSYAEHVAPILQAKCQACHRPDQVGPFPLLTFEQAYRHRLMIREVVSDYRMPPWHADPRHGSFANDRSLSPEQLAMLVAWVDQGAPEGDPTLAPEPAEFTEGWTIGTPDVVIEMPQPFVVPAQGAVRYQYIRIRSPFEEDTWVQAVEARPGVPAVVHHVVVYIDDASARDGKEEKEAGEGAFENVLVTYVPGDAPTVFPEGVALKIPAGADLVFQMHYTPVGKVAVDRSSIGLIQADRPSRRAKTLLVLQPNLNIPPGAADHPERAEYTLPKDATLYSLFPHMHVRGKSFRYRATYPDGSREVLLSVPAYDFNWQSVYRLAEPKRLPAGTVIECEAHFDNSAGNAANPDPTIEVRWGDQTWEEMLAGFLDVTFEDAPPDDLAEAGSVAGAGD
ncbi:redoxin domain-containing protein [Tautonia marina]|uniref:redoxin domain-containing protein n=1 Tax=Tautonia marina TaxID=2653855 RepID=UPI001376425D|nr:redoxin domain-containing protein [Tautonia marina]